jgi:hypothetical protein
MFTLFIAVPENKIFFPPLELTSDIEVTCEKFEAWKAHTVRTIIQDDAKSTVLEKLTGKEVLIIVDWAMKWLPVKFRETQSEWFGTKGISWHVSACTTKLSACAAVSDQFEVQFLLGFSMT